ncbi:sugar phosphate isomerase/epimerase [Algoriphagus sp.]|uniref:sugar phosphate isomerase/epimerase family protein n=1 Tax=Algoriphagus sp. TaxID=1872435 RepID=UPI003289FB11
MSKNHQSSRRDFIQKSILAASCTLFLPKLVGAASLEEFKKVKINGHLWVYASKFPPNWDAYPDLEIVFADMSYAGLDGIELMESILRHDDAVERIKELTKKYKIGVSGTSYGVGFNMWDASQYQAIADDLELVIPRLAEVGGTTFGVSVGGADHLKTDAELDAQAKILNFLMKICKENGIVPNLHNHTYEVENDLHDLKGTLARIPDIKLGPDLNWLIRGGVDPVEFIETYGEQIVYLHIRDQYEDGTWTEYVGQGDTDFSAISKALEKQNFQGQVAIELAFPNDFTPSNPLKEDWKISRKFVQKTFGW